MKFFKFLVILVLVVVGQLGSQLTKGDDNNQMILVDENPVEEDTSNDNDNNNNRRHSFDIKFDETGDGLDTFVPTKEWQVIKPGQAIPKGIHVRLNIQTGEREGKLLDEAESQTEKVNTISESISNAKRKISKELEDAIKSLNDDFKDKDEPESVEVRFRT